MARSRITRWNGDALVRALRSHLTGNAAAAGAELVGEYRRLLSTAYPPASSPGEPPHRRSGEGLASIHHVPRTMGVDVVCDADYMHILNEGGTHVAARPWKQEGFDAALDRIRRTMTRRLPGG